MWKWWRFPEFNAAIWHYCCSNLIRLFNDTRWCTGWYWSLHSAIMSRNRVSHASNCTIKTHYFCFQTNIGADFNFVFEELILHFESCILLKLEISYLVVKVHRIPSKKQTDLQYYSRAAGGDNLSMNHSPYTGSIRNSLRGDVYCTKKAAEGASFIVHVVPLYREQEAVWDLVSISVSVSLAGESKRQQVIMFRHIAVSSWR